MKERLIFFKALFFFAPLMQDETLDAKKNQKKSRRKKACLPKRECRQASMRKATSLPRFSAWSPLAFCRKNLLIIAILIPR